MKLLLDVGALIGIDRDDRRVALLAGLALPGDQLLTSDPDDLGQLLQAHRVEIPVVTV